MWQIQASGVSLRHPTNLRRTRSCKMWAKINTTQVHMDPRGLQDLRVLENTKATIENQSDIFRSLNMVSNHVTTQMRVMTLTDHHL